jgi:4-hydroxythreonine-4-phosphate dehydrogenase
MSKPIVITMGEPAGIGGELVLKAWSTLRDRGHHVLVVDDPARLQVLSAKFGLGVKVQSVAEPFDAISIMRRALPVLPLGMSVVAEAGRPHVCMASAVLQSIETAVGLVRNSEASAVVTNPIQKSVLYDADFKFPGHTEYLGALCRGADPVMMLASEELRVVPVTVHMALRNAISCLHQDLIVAQARVTARALRQDFGIAAPRLAVLGLNPHAGEEGTMGDEDQRIIAPAVATLQREGIDAFGPLPPDTAFTPRARKGYDVAMCMYHDQALIPLKTLDVDGGVNVTLNLPIVRTSPDHGTALDIAGKGVADPGSLIAAVELAAAIARQRQETQP